MFDKPFLYTTKEECERVYRDHLESVRLSGLGHEDFEAEILTWMEAEMALFD